MRKKIREVLKLTDKIKKLLIVAYEIKDTKFRICIPGDN